MLQGGVGSPITDLHEGAVVAQLGVFRSFLEQAEKEPLGCPEAAASQMLVGEFAVCLGRQGYCLNVATPVTN